MAALPASCQVTQSPTPPRELLWAPGRGGQPLGLEPPGSCRGLPMSPWLLWVLYCQPSWLFFLLFRAGKGRDLLT